MWKSVCGSVCSPWTSSLMWFHTLTLISLLLYVVITKDTAGVNDSLRMIHYLSSAWDCDHHIRVLDSLERERFISFRLL